MRPLGLHGFTYGNGQKVGISGRPKKSFARQRKKKTSEAFFTRDSRASARKNPVMFIVGFFARQREKKSGCFFWGEGRLPLCFLEDVFVGL